MQSLDPQYEYKKNWRETHREQDRQSKRNYCLNHPIENKEKHRNWNLKHSEYYKNWRLEHREQINEYTKNWRRQNHKKAYAELIAWRNASLASKCQFGNCDATEHLQRAHLDYDYPLLVVTFCARHHSIIDRLYKETD